VTAERARLQVLALQRAAGANKRGEPFEEQQAALALDAQLRALVAQWEVENA
jgi:hypothetical protein